MQAVLAVGVKPLRFQPVRAGVSLAQLYEEHTHRLSPVARNAHPCVQVTGLHAVESAVLQYIAPHLVQRDLQAYLLLCDPVHVADVQLVAQHPEGGDIVAALERSGAQGLVVRACGHVRRIAALRISEAVALLYVHAAQGVGVVACPDLRKITQETEVEAIAAGRAALEEDMREPLSQRAHHAVQPLHIAVSGLALLLGRQIRRKYV